MSKSKKVIILCLSFILVSSMSLIAYAATNYENPADAVSAITGRSLESVVAEKRETGKTFGEIAKDANALNEFKTAMLEMKKEKLDTKVAEGVITQEEADEILKTIENNMANCDGSGNKRIGKQAGAQFGKNANGARKNGQNGAGKRMGNKLGLKLQDGLRRGK